MEHQYPGAISGDENMLAELMLPDQAHMRNEDWTIFFLHKDTSEAVTQDSVNGSAKRKRQENKNVQPDTSDTEGDSVEETDGEEEGAEGEGDGEEEIEGGEGPPLIYVLNLVNTKQDNTVRRSATLPLSPMSIADDKSVTEVPLSKPWPFVHGIPFFISTRYSRSYLYRNLPLTLSKAALVVSIGGVLQITLSRDASFIVRRR